jgi:hypothetical protein
MSGAREKEGRGRKERKGIGTVEGRRVTIPLHALRMHNLVNLERCNSRPNSGSSDVEDFAGEL